MMTLRRPNFVARRPWIVGGFIVFTGAAVWAQTAARPPQQPKTGPGSSEASHASVRKTLYGSGSTAYWLFEPASSVPASAPLIVFNHGWGGTNPEFYGAWIDHIVRRGNIVIYPRYQESLRTPAPQFTPSALSAIKDGIGRLQTEKGHATPDLNRFAIVGHSGGGLLTANEAALAAKNGLPKPRAVMCVEPAHTISSQIRTNFLLADLAAIPSDTFLIALTGDKDLVAGDADAKRVFKESTNVPLANKNFVTLVSDAHGKPELWATHSTPTARDMSYSDVQAQGKPEVPDRVRERLRDRLAEQRGIGTKAPEEAAMRGVANAHDFYGTWKLFDALCDAAFYGKNREFALGNTPQQRFMGTWSDSTPVKELIVTDKP